MRAGYAAPVTTVRRPAPGEVATHAADEDAAALWRVEEARAGEGRDEEPRDMHEKSDDYHIWLRDPQAGRQKLTRWRAMRAEGACRAGLPGRQ